MRWWFFSIGCAVGCGQDLQANLVAEFGWTFDYGNWTASVPVPDLRACDNVPGYAVKVPYAAVDHVDVVVEDALGQVPGFEGSFPCSQGEGSTRLRVVGIHKQVYRLSLKAYSKAGHLLYSYTQEELDLTRPVNEQYMLRAETSEMTFIPEFQGSDDCAGVESLAYAFFLKGENGVASEATYSGEAPACDLDQPAEVTIRDIPMFPTAGQNDNYIPTYYDVVLEGKSSGTTRYCARERYAFNPGPRDLASSPTLTAGRCP